MAYYKVINESLSNLNRFSPQRQQLIQAIEVKAFGYLVADMLNLIDNPTSPQAEILHQLAQDCLQSSISSRPSFNTLRARLSSMG